MNQETEDQFLDIVEILRPVAKTYGRPMFTLVLQAGLGREAAEVLSQVNRGNPRSLHAVGLLANAFNWISNHLIAAEGWTQEELAQCDRDIQRAWQGQIQTTKGPDIVWEH